MTSPPTIRPATPADLDAILALERSIPTAPHWPMATYAAIVQSIAESTTLNRCLYVAHTPSPSSTLTGFAAAQLPPSQGLAAELESIAVAPHARRTGIGRALVSAVVDWCRVHGATSIALEVRSQSSPAVALYSSLGFLPTGLRPLYYTQPDDDALLLTRSLLEP